jgi:hypothetical protein
MSMPRLRIDFGDKAPRLVVKAAQDLGAAVELRHLHPEPGQMQANSQAM